MDPKAKTILQAIAEHTKRVDEKAERINKSICPNCGYEHEMTDSSKERKEEETDNN